MFTGSRTPNRKAELSEYIRNTKTIRKFVGKQWVYGENLPYTFVLQGDWTLLYSPMIEVFYFTVSHRGSVSHNSRPFSISQLNLGRI